MTQLLTDETIHSGYRFSHQTLISSYILRPPWFWPGIKITELNKKRWRKLFILIQELFKIVLKIIKFNSYLFNIFYCSQLVSWFITEILCTKVMLSIVAYLRVFLTNYANETSRIWRTQLCWLRKTPFL